MGFYFHGSFRMRRPSHRGRPGSWRLWHPRPDRSAVLRRLCPAPTEQVSVEREAGLAGPTPPDVAPAPVMARPVQRLGAGNPSKTAPRAVAARSPHGGFLSDQQAQVRPRAFDVAGSYASCS